MGCIYLYTDEFGVKHKVDTKEEVISLLREERKRLRTDEDASMLYDFIPIAIRDESGKIIGYLHNTLYPLDHTKSKNIKQDVAAIRKVRNRLMQNGGSFDTIIKEKRKGVLALTKEPRGLPTVKAVSEKEPQIVIRTRESMSSNKPVDEDVSSLEFRRLGIPYIAGTTANGSKVSIPLKMNRLNEKYRKSIINAIKAWIARKDIGSYEISNIEELLRYVAQYVMNTIPGEEYNGRFDNLVAFQPNDRGFINIIPAGNAIDIGIGGMFTASVRLNEDGIPTFFYNEGNKKKKIQYENFIELLNETLSRVYHNVNTKVLSGSRKYENIIITDEFRAVQDNEATTYIDLIRNNSTTNAMSFEVDEDTHVYTIQPTLTIDLDGLTLDEAEEEIEELLSSNDESIAVHKQQRKELSRYSKKLDDNIVRLSEKVSSLSLKGMTPLQQEEVVNWIASEFVREVLDASIGLTPEEDIKTFNIEEIFNKIKKKLLSNRDRAEQEGKVTIVSRYDNILGNENLGIESQWGALKLLTFIRVQQVQGIKIFGDIGDYEGYNEKLDYSKSNLEVDTRDYGSIRLKHFLSVIPDTRRVVGDVAISKKGSYLGEPKYLMFDKVYGDIRALLTNRVGSYEDFINVLRSKIEEKPYIKYVIDKLEEAKRDGRDDIVNEFISHMESRTTNMKTIVVESGKNKETKAKIINTNRSNIAELLLQEWESNLYNLDAVETTEEGNRIKEEDLEEFIRKGERLKSMLKASRTKYGWKVSLSSKDREVFTEQLQEWMESLGIKLNDAVYEKYLEKSNLAYIFHSPTGWGNILLNRLRFLRTQTLEESPLLNDGVLRRLAASESYYRPDLQTISFLNGENKQVTAYSLPEFLSDRIVELKQNRGGIIERLLSNPFSENSLWLQMIKSGNTDDLLDFITLDTFRMSLFRKGKPFNKLDITDLEMAKLALLANRGTIRGQTDRVIYIVHPTIAGKDRVVAIRTIAIDTYLESRENLEGNPLRGDTLRFKNLYEIGDEENESNIVENSDWIEEAKKIFSENEVLRKLIFKNIGIREEEATDNDKQSAEDEFIKYASQAVAANRKSSEPLSISKGTAKRVFDNVVLPEIKRILSFQNVKTGIEEFDKGSGKFLLIPELSNKEKFGFLWDGDNLKDLKTLESDGSVDKIIEYLRNEYLEELVQQRVDFWKRSEIVGTDSDGNITSISKIDGNYIKLFSKRFSGKNTLENTVRNIALDYEVNYLAGNVNYMQIFSGDPAYYYKEIQGENESETILRTAYKTYDNITKRLARNIAPGFKLADSYGKKYKVGIIPEILGDSLSKQLAKKKEYRNIVYADGQEWITVEEATYILWKQGRITEKKRKDIIRNAYNNTLSEGDISSILTVQKPVQTGNRQHSVYNIEVPVYIKSSSFTLIPQLVKGTDLEHLLEAMKNNNLQRVTVPSAIKVGMPSFELNSIVDSKGNLLVENLKFDGNNILELDRGYFRIQQDIPYDPTKDEVVDGTQQMVLLFESIRHIKSTNSDIRDIEDVYKEYIENYRELFKVKQEDLKNFLLKEDGSLDIGKVKSLLLEEAIRLGFKQNDIDLLSLPDDEFVKYFFYSQSHDSVEAILQALVDKRIRRNRMHGRALVLGSEFGFKVRGVEALSGLEGIEVESGEELNKKIEEYKKKREDLIDLSKKRQKEYSSRIDALNKDNNISEATKLRKENEDLLLKETNEISDIDDNIRNLQSALQGGRFKITGKTGITFTQKFSGELLPQRIDEKTGEVLPGQVLLPWRMRDSITGKEIRIEKYLDENDMLDLSKVPEEVLKIFGYRIPTSKHGSMTMIEVVGFLPVWVGDLIIASRDLVTQTGMDFDVDKLFMFEYNVVEENGKIRKFKEGDQIKDVNNWYGDLTAFGSKIAAKINIKLRKQGKELTSKLKALQNKILDNHIEVMSNREVFEKYVTNPVGYGELPNIAETIRERRSLKSKFKPISEAYHRDKYKASSAAETAVGVFSNTITFLAKAQDPLNAKGSEKKNIMFWNKDRPYYLQIGVEKSKPISSIEGAAKGVSKIEVASAFQNVAVDDATLNIAGDLNINNQTFQVIDAMIAMGFSEKAIAALINQDIIYDYIELAERSMYSQSSDNRMSEDEIISTLRKKYDSEKYRESIKTRKKDFSLYSADDLLNLIGRGKEDTFAQNMALTTFIVLKKYGAQLSKINKVAQVNSARFNKSLLYNILLEEESKELYNNAKIINAHRIFVDVEGNSDSIPGFALESLKLNNELWRQLLPYDKNAVHTAIAQVEEAINARNLNTDSRAQLRREVIEGLKSYIYSRLVSDPVALRKRYTIYDGKTPTLGQILMAIKNSSLYAADNPLIRRLKTRVYKRQGKVVNVWFDNTATQDLVIDQYYNAFIELLADDSIINLDGITGKTLTVMLSVDRETATQTSRFHLDSPRVFESKDKDGVVRRYNSVWHAYQTWKTGKFNEEAYKEFLNVVGNVRKKTDIPVKFEKSMPYSMSDPRYRLSSLEGEDMIDFLSSGEVDIVLLNHSGFKDAKLGDVIRVMDRRTKKEAYVRVKNIRRLSSYGQTSSQLIEAVNKAGFNKYFYNAVLDRVKNSVDVVEVEYIDDKAVLKEYVEKSILYNYAFKETQRLLEYDNIRVTRPGDRLNAALQESLMEVRDKLAKKLLESDNEELQSIAKRYKGRQFAIGLKAYRVKDFARDLIIYDMITGGNLTPISYNRLIPFAARKLIVEEAIKDIDLNNEDILGYADEDISIFAEQFIQHKYWRLPSVKNSDVLEKSDDEVIKSGTITLSEDGRFINDEGILLDEGLSGLPKYLNYITKKGERLLLKRVGESRGYLIIDKRGKANMSDYVFEGIISDVAMPGYSKKVIKAMGNAEPSPASFVMPVSTDADFLGINPVGGELPSSDTVLERISMDEDNPSYSVLSTFFLDKRDKLKNVKVRIVTRDEINNEYGREVFKKNTKAMYAPNKGIIYINRDILNTTRSNIEYQILHEAGHAITYEALKDPANKEYRDRLELLMKEFMENENVSKDIKRMVGTGDSAIFEFVTLLLSNRAIQNAANSIQSKVGKRESLFRKIMNLLKEIVKSFIGMEVQQGSVLERGLDEILHLVKPTDSVGKVFAQRFGEGQAFKEWINLAKRRVAIAREQVKRVSESKRLSPDEEIKSYIGYSLGRVWGEELRKIGLKSNGYSLTSDKNSDLRDVSELIEQFSSYIEEEFKNDNISDKKKNELIDFMWSVTNSDSLVVLAKIKDGVFSSKIDNILRAFEAVKNNMNLPRVAYVFDTNTKQWFTFRDGNLIKSDVPVLTEKFIGVEDNNIGSNGRGEIKNIINRTKSFIENIFIDNIPKESKEELEQNSKRVVDTTTHLPIPPDPSSAFPPLEDLERLFKKNKKKKDDDDLNSLHSNFDELDGVVAEKTHSSVLYRNGSRKAVSLRNRIKKIKSSEKWLKENIRAFNNTIDSESKVVKNQKENIYKIPSIGVLSIISRKTKRPHLKLLSDTLINNISEDTNVKLFNIKKYDGITAIAYDSENIFSDVRVEPPKYFKNVDDFYDTVIHEEIHRYTEYVLSLDDDSIINKYGRNSSEYRFKKEIESLHSIFIKETNYRGELEDIGEFMAYGLTNEGIIKKLKNIKVDNTNLFDKIIQAILKLLGVNRSNVYDLLLKSFTDYYNNRNTKIVDAYLEVNSIDTVAYIPKDSLMFSKVLNTYLDHIAAMDALGIERNSLESISYLNSMISGENYINSMLENVDSGSINDIIISPFEKYTISVGSLLEGEDKERFVANAYIEWALGYKSIEDIILDEVNRVSMELQEKYDPMLNTIYNTLTGQLHDTTIINRINNQQRLLLKSIENNVINNNTINSLNVNSDIKKALKVITKSVSEDTDVQIVSPKSEEFVLYSSDDELSTLEPIREDFKIRIDDLQKTVSRIRNIRGSEGRVEKLQARINTLTKDLDILNRASNLYHLVSIGKRDIERLKNIIGKKDIQIEDIKEGRRIINLWNNAIELLFTPFERKYRGEIHKAYTEIANKISYMEGTYFNKIEIRFLEKFLSDAGVEVDIIEEMKRSNDIDAMWAKSMDITRTDNAMLQGIGKWFMERNDEARRSAREKISKLERLLDKNKELLARLSNNGNPFDIFFQRRESGELTNRLVQLLTPEFYDTKWKLFYRAKKIGSKEAWTEYYKFLKENTIVFDVRMLYSINGVFSGEDIEFNKTKVTFDKDSKAIEQHKQRLKSLLGENEYNRLVSELKNRIEEYAYRYNLNKERIWNETDNSKLREKLLRIWVQENSPYWHVEGVYASKKVTDPGVSNKFGYKYTYEVASKEKWYDKRFKKIQEDKNLLELYDYIHDIIEDVRSLSTESQQDYIEYGAIPSLTRAATSIYNEAGMRGAFSALYDSFIKFISENAYGSKEFVDPVTKESIRKLDTGVSYSKDEVSKIYNRLVIEFKQTYNRNPIEIERDSFWKKATSTVAEKSDRNLERILKAAILSSEMYRHKAALEEPLRIAKRIISESRETRKSGKYIGEVLPVEDSFRNMATQFDHFIKGYYGIKKEASMKSEKKYYTKEEQEQLKEIETLLANNEEGFKEGKISEDEYNKNKNKLEYQKNSLGRNITERSVGKALVQIMQWKGMGWNWFAAINNLGFGFISNYVEAADGRIYRTKELNEAYGLVLSHSVTKNWTLNNLESTIARKIRGLMDKNDVLRDASYELVEYDSSSMIKKTKRLAPLAMQKHTEYINYSAVMIATLKTKKAPNGKSLWEGYDENGNWKGGEEWGAEPKDIWITIRQANKMNHGNYDPDSILGLKENIVTQMLSQFRLWMFEMFANRFEREKFDRLLGITRKGRYRTGFAFLTWAKTKEGVNMSAFEKNLYVLGQFARKLAFMPTKFDEKFTEVDAANLRKNLTETLIYLGLMTFYMMLKQAVGKGDDGDERKKWLFYTMMNSLTRLQTDILFYINPLDMQALLRKPVPAAGLLVDTIELSSAVGRYLMDDDIIKSGVYAKQSRLARELAQFFPGTTQIYRTYSIGKILY